LNACASTAGCVAGYACNSSGQCVPATTGAAAEDSGCSCRLHTSSGLSFGWALLGLLGLGGAVGRRRWAGSRAIQLH
jgi:hypothetical protein